MKCPVCLEPDLLMTERQGIEIDYCPRCRGVWLDRGELDRLIERAAAPGPAPARATPEPVREPRWEQPAPRDADHRDTGHRREGDRHRDEHYRDERYRDDHYRHHKRKSFLGELFDFD